MLSVKQSLVWLLYPLITATVVFCSWDARLAGAHRHWHRQFMLAGPQLPWDPSGSRQCRRPSGHLSSTTQTSACIQHRSLILQSRCWRSRRLAGTEACCFTFMPCPRRVTEFSCLDDLVTFSSPRPASLQALANWDMAASRISWAGRPEEGAFSIMSSSFSASLSASDPSASRRPSGAWKWSSAVVSPPRLLASALNRYMRPYQARTVWPWTSWVMFKAWAGGLMLGSTNCFMASPMRRMASEGSKDGSTIVPSSSPTSKPLEGAWTSAVVASSKNRAGVMTKKAPWSTWNGRARSVSAWGASSSL
mmetsp:Transcript_22085/g.53792  ORF Transcript_22085/g.53792 Transcript_22085/m.53792 type:complete len:306 (+) Transcript_22085:787-1704(+)